MEEYEYMVYVSIFKLWHDEWFCRSKFSAEKSHSDACRATRLYYVKSICCCGLNEVNNTFR